MRKYIGWIAIGSLALLACCPAEARTVLSIDTTLYVSPSGNDSNDCLSASTPCATIQRTWDLAADNYDLAGHALTIQLADGTYTSGLSTKRGIVGSRGFDGLTIKGNAAAPGNAIVSTTGVSAFQFGGGEALAAVHLTIRDLEIRTTTSGNGIDASGGGTFIFFDNLRFGNIANCQIAAQFYALVQSTHTAYAVTGNAMYHVVAQAGGQIHIHNTTVTFSNNPNFSQSFAYASSLGIIYDGIMVFINGGTVTGKRYACSSNSYVWVAGGGANYLPGNVAGTTATGCVYE